MMAELKQPAARPLDSGLAIGKLEVALPHADMLLPAEAFADCGAKLRAFVAEVPGGAPKS